MASNLLSIMVLAAFAVHFSATQQACQASFKPNPVKIKFSE